MQTQATRAANMEPIPGYRLQCLLGQGGFGEVWRCEAPGGLLKAIKFVPGVQENNTLHGERNVGAVRELQALELIKAIRHPFILSVDRVEIIDDDLVIVTELADQNLYEVLQYYRGQGKEGLPRPELLRYLREAAEALDVLEVDHGLQHLDVKPHNLFLVNRHVKVGDFGLVSSLADLQDQPDGAVHLEAISPLYAAPESFMGKVTAFTDQYSLAISYHELLTGRFPFSGRNFRQLALQRLQAEPDLSMVGEGDRAALARALSRDPRDRFSSCMDFVEALETGETGSASVSVEGPTLPPLQNSTKEVRVLGDMGATRSVARPDLSKTPAPDEENPALTPGTSRMLQEDILGEYTFLECVARLPVGEAWKAHSSSGNLKRVKLLASYPDEDESEGVSPLRRLKSIRHQGLVPRKIVRDKNHRVAIISPWIEANLGDHLASCQNDGLEGIPREELLDYLSVVARSLDELHDGYQLQHLTLSPRQLLVDQGEMLVSDFGLAALLWMPMGHQPAALNTKYSAPELFENDVSPSCDLYSLALIYQELRTGAHAFRNMNPRQMARARLRGQPDLGMLTDKERVVLGKALHTEPSERFESCQEMIEALRNQSNQGAVTTRSFQEHSTRIVAPNGSASGESLRPNVSRAGDTGFAPLVHQIAGGWEARPCTGYRYLLRPGDSILHHGFLTGAMATVRLKLKGFREEWKADLVVQEKNRHVLHVFQKGNMFSRWFSRERGLELDLRTEPSSSAATSATGYALTISILGEVDDGSARLLEDLGPRLIESLRRHLQASSERRGEERFPLKHPVEVFSVTGENRFGDGVLGETFNISEEGIGLMLPFEPPTNELGVQIHSPLLPGASALVTGSVMYVSPCNDGRYCVGVALGR